MRTGLTVQLSKGLTAVVVLALSGLAHAAPPQSPAQQLRRDPVRITALEGGKVRFGYGPQQATLNLRQDIHGCAAVLYDPVTGDTAGLGYGLRVIDEVQEGGFWYVVLQADSGPNCNVQGECGAGGPNTDLIWLKLNRQLEVVAKQVENLDDCISGRGVVSLTGHVQGPPENQSTLLELRGGVLAVRVSGAANGGYGGRQAAFSLRYRHAQPWRGLIIGP